MTIQEIAIMLKDHINYEEKRDSVIDKKLDEIIAAQKYTNGNVTALQKKDAQKAGWILGLGVSMPVIMGLIVYIWFYAHPVK